MSYAGGYADGFAAAGTDLTRTNTDNLTATDAVTAVRQTLTSRYAFGYTGGYGAAPLSDSVAVTDALTVLRGTVGTNDIYADSYAPSSTAGNAFQVDVSALTDSVTVLRTGGGVENRVATLTDSLRAVDAVSASRVTPTIPVDVPARMRLRLVAYNPGGEKRGDVPFGLSLARYVQMGEVPTAEAEYSFLQRNVLHLDGPVEVALQYSDANGQWVEPVNGRYLIDKDDYDRMDNGQLIHRYGFLGYVTQLRYADVGTLSLNAEGQRPFNSQTPGGIMQTLITEAKAAGFLPFVNIGFTANVTSDGQPWAKVATRAFSPETDLLSVLQNFFEAGLADFWTDGRTLHMSNPDTVLGRELSVGPSPVYVRDQTLTASPESVTYGDMITKVRVVGDNGFKMLRDNPTASRAFGERVKTLSLGGVSDVGTATIYADQLLETGEAPSRSLSREYTVTEQTRYAPERDYRTGDWIRADTATTRGERMRAFATSVREEGGELKAFVTLGTVHDDLLLRLAKRQNGIVGGSGVNNGGTPAPTIPDQAVPKAPVGLVVDADVYNDNAGYAHAVIAATWSAVTESTTGGGVDVVGYELWYRENRAGETSRMLRRVQDTTVTYSPLVTGRAYAFKVRAYTDTKSSAFSPEVVLTTPTDAVPPPVPSLPITTSTLGVVTVAWDGRSNTGGAMPFDFDHVNIYQQAGASSVLIDSLFVKGFTSIGGLTAGDTYNFALQAVDKTGNVSALTAWVAQPVVSVVYTTQISDAGITAPKIATNAILADHIQVGAIDGMLITAPIIRTAATGQRSQFDTQGLRLWNAANQVKLWANPATGQLRIYNTGDASHTSTGHGLQFGDDTGPNLLLDNNEIMARNNGGYAQLLLNREGGPILLGGIMGGLDPDGTRIYPKTGNHVISLRGHVLISNTQDSDNVDNFPPLLIGTGGGQHLYFDNNEIGSSTGFASATLYLNHIGAAGSGSGGTGYHAEPVMVGSNALGLRRHGSFTAGDRGGLIFAGDTSVNAGIRITEGPSGPEVRAVQGNTNSGGVNMVALDYLFTSEQRAKTEVEDFDPLPIVKAARGKRWKYRDEIEPADVVHFGPMVEDLPAEHRRPIGPNRERVDGEEVADEFGAGMLALGIGSLNGILWESVRLLIARVETLEQRTPGPITPTRGPSDG